VKKYKGEHEDYYRKYFLKRNRDMRKTVIEHYGAKCACCGDTNYEHLSIDHINNDGAEHRKTTNGQILQDTLNRGFPDNIQILCYNCNMTKNRNSDKRNKYQLKYRRRLLSLFGSKCSVCGCDNEWALELDHIGGGGKNEYRNIPHQTVKRMLLDGTIDRDGYRLLCANCNMVDYRTRLSGNENRRIFYTESPPPGYNLKISNKKIFDRFDVLLEKYTSKEWVTL